MEKNEHAIFLDIPSGGKNGRYHSAILTTYAIDLIHFDNQLLNMLHRKQICSVNVFADCYQMEKSMEYINPIYMKNIGKDYSVTSLKSIGAFHPKINFFVGDESVLVVFGTGNLTVTGHGKNHEAFTGFMIDKTNNSHRPLIEECWQYLTRFTNQCGEFERNRILREIPDNCAFLDPSFKIVPHQMCNVQEGLAAALLYNDSKSSILQQIRSIVPLEDIQKITVLSPFFDENGESLITLSQLCPKARVNVLIHKNCALPPCKIKNNKKIEFFDFTETKRGKANFKTYDRQLHAKIIHFKSFDAEYCVIGSANATTSGLGTLTKKGINDEFCVLYQSDKKDFLALLGLNTRKKLDVQVWNLSRSGNSIAETKNKYRLLSIQYESGKLSVISAESLPKDTQLAIDNGSDVYFFKLNHVKACRYEIKFRLDKIQSICYLINADGSRISNKVFVNRIDLLATTNPSKTSRNLNKVISCIENNSYNGMEIAEILSDVMWDLVIDSGEKVYPKIKTSSGKIKIKDKSLPDIKYNPEYDNDDAKNRSIIQIDRTSKLIECIEESIRKKIRSIEDAINDEEEEGNAETSNNREIEEQEDIPISQKNIKGYGELSTSVLDKYRKLISERFNQVNASGDDVVTKDDLNFFSLSLFAAMEICYLNRFRYQFGEMDSMSRSYYQKYLYDSLDRSICIKGLESIECFVKFCNSIKVPKEKDENYKRIACRAMKYAILYGALFFKFSNIENKNLRGNRVKKAIGYLTSLFGMPSYKFLSRELEPLSERYGYAFRMKHVEYFIKMLNIK